MAAGDHTVTGTMTANKVAVTDTVVVANLNADQVDGADKDIDGTLAGNSDASVPTEKAVKTYVDTHAALAVAGTHGSTVAATASKLMHRDASGRAKVAAPAAVDDIARKDTVDAVQTNLNTHAALAVEGTHGSTVAATANKLVHRDAAGRAKVVAPAAAADIALKSTVTADIATHAALAVAGTHGSTVAATANKLVHRDASGRAQVAAPSADADIARKDTPAVSIIETGASAILKAKKITLTFETDHWEGAHGLTYTDIVGVAAVTRKASGSNSCFAPMVDATKVFIIPDIGRVCKIAYPLIS